MTTVDDLAKMIDHSILHPTYTSMDLKRECEIAKKYKVATVCVKPYAVMETVEIMQESDVLICAVIGFPHGNSKIQVKKFETNMAIEDGAHEIDMVVNIGKVLEEDWEYVKSEIEAIVILTKTKDVVLKVIFENDYLLDDNYKIKLCEICTELKVDFVKTSTGYGFVKGNDGKYAYKGATNHDLMLMRKYSGPDVQIKAAGGVRSLDDLLKVKELGVARIGATATIAIIEEAKKRFK